MKHLYERTALLIGTALLIAGSVIFPAPDWDVGVSLLMAGFTYVSAQFWQTALRKHQWSQLPIALFLTWWALDGVYLAYWTVVDPAALVMRDSALAVNVCLYLMASIIFVAAGKIDLHLSQRNPDTSHSGTVPNGS